MEEETLATYRNNKRVSALGHPCPVQDKNRGDIIGGGVLHLEAFLCSLGLGWPWGLMTVGFIAIFFFFFPVPTTPCNSQTPGCCWFTLKLLVLPGSGFGVRVIISGWVRVH